MAVAAAEDPEVLAEDPVVQEVLAAVQQDHKETQQVDQIIPVAVAGVEDITMQEFLMVAATEDPEL
jgi:hypothetical protein